MKLATLGVATILILATAAVAHQEAAPASGAFPGEVVARLPWGDGDKSVGGENAAPGPNGSLEGIPASFICDESGAVHILDTPNRRIMLLKPGAPPVVVSLAALGADLAAVDFASRGKGWLVADQATNTVTEIGPDGAAGQRWSGFQHIHRLEAEGDRVFARDEAALSVSRLDAGGKVEEISKNVHATPVTIGGQPVLARVVNGQAVFQLGGAVFSLAAHQAGDDVQGLEVAGVDAKGALILACHEGKGDDRRGVWLQRVGADGAVQAEAQLPPSDEKYTIPARFYRAQSDGRVLTFRTSDAAYELSRVTLAPPAAARSATRAPAAAEEEARAALCKGESAARAALSAALIAAAFDDAASARMERDFAALEAGTPAAQLCALNNATAALSSGDAAKALKLVEAVDSEHVKDRRLYIEGTALEKTGELREGLRRWQRIVLDHAESPHFAEANANVLRIVDSGKLPGATAK